MSNNAKVLNNYLDKLRDVISEIVDATEKICDTPSDSSDLNEVVQTSSNIIYEYGQMGQNIAKELLNLKHCNPEAKSLIGAESQKIIIYQRVQNRPKKQLKITSNEKRFQCNLCSYSTNLPNVFRDHMDRHAGIKPFKCSICKKRFLKNTTLKVHIRLHTGEGLHECSHCGRGFNYPMNLKRHIQEQHEQKEHDENILKV